MMNKSIYAVLFFMTVMAGYVNAMDELLEKSESYSWNGESIKLMLGYPDVVKITTNQDNEIRVLAKIGVHNHGGENISEDFVWEYNSESGEVTINANFGRRIKNTMITETGSDISAGVPKDATYTKTQIVISIPNNAALDIKSFSGSISIEHPGNTLLIDTIAHVEILLEKNLGITTSINTMMGSITTDDSLNVREISQNDIGRRALKTRQNMFHINGGGAETSVISIAGDIHFSQKL